METLFDESRLKKALAEARLDALLATSRPNFVYLSGVFQQIEASFLRQEHAGVVATCRRDELEMVPIVP